jgi:acetolactate synthase-1/2/3 large subunit
MRNGGRLLVDCLAVLGATKAFGVHGQSYLAVLDAHHDSHGRLDFAVLQRGRRRLHGVCLGKLTSKPGICFVTSGPGATSASIGIHTAMQDS